MNIIRQGEGGYLKEEMPVETSFNEVIVFSASLQEMIAICECGSCLAFGKE